MPHRGLLKALKFERHDGTQKSKYKSMGDSEKIISIRFDSYEASPVIEDQIPMSCVKDVTSQCATNGDDKECASVDVRVRIIDCIQDHIFVTLPSAQVIGKQIDCGIPTTSILSVTDKEINIAIRNVEGFCKCRSGPFKMLLSVKTYFKVD